MEHAGKTRLPMPGSDLPETHANGEAWLGFRGLEFRGLGFRVSLGLYRDDGREIGNYYSGFRVGLYRGYTGIMEKRMESTI